MVHKYFAHIQRDGKHEYIFFNFHIHSTSCFYRVVVYYGNVCNDDFAGHYTDITMMIRRWMERQWHRQHKHDQLIPRPLLLFCENSFVPFAKTQYKHVFNWMFCGYGQFMAELKPNWSKLFTCTRHIAYEWLPRALFMSQKGPVSFADIHSSGIIPVSGLELLFR